MKKKFIVRHWDGDYYCFNNNDRLSYSYWHESKNKAYVFDSMEEIEELVNLNLINAFSIETIYYKK